MIRDLQVSSKKRKEFIEMTALVQDVIDQVGVTDGMCYIFVPHTTAAVTINENADPHVMQDMDAKLSEVIPASSNYLHSEGNSDAHIKASLLGQMQAVIVHNGSLVLGTWQGIFFAEFDGPRKRKVIIKLQPIV